MQDNVKKVCFTSLTSILLFLARQHSISRLITGLSYAFVSFWPSSFLGVHQKFFVFFLELGVVFVRPV